MCPSNRPPTSGVFLNFICPLRLFFPGVVGVGRGSLGSPLLLPFPLFSKDLPLVFSVSHKWCRSAHAHVQFASSAPSV